MEIEASEVADVIGGALLEVDNRLGIEISEPRGGEDRDAIITAYSDPSLFPLVRQIVGLLSGVADWNIMALKPARGFDFSINIAKKRMDAKAIHFSPIADIASGIQLLVPQELLGSLPPEESDREELAWLLVETGVGEELSVKLQHVEFASIEKVADSQPINSLSAWLRKLK